jgi:hypothetical protein
MLGAVTVLTLFSHRRTKTHSIPGSSILAYLVTGIGFQYNLRCDIKPREISSSELGCTAVPQKQSMHVPHNGKSTSAILVNGKWTLIARLCHFTPRDSAGEGGKALL